MPKHQKYPCRLYGNEVPNNPLQNGSSDSNLKTEGEAINNNKKFTLRQEC